MAINANSHPYKVVVGDGTSPIYANRHPIKVEVEGGVVTPEEFEELEKKVDALATDLSYKGGVPTYDDLPADPEQGDVYTVEDTGVLYVWDGDEWVALNDTSSNTIVADSAPTTSTEGEVGQFYVNTSNGKVYVLTSISGDTYNWDLVGPTVVQSTGQSTTSVMSQKAVTDAIATAGVQELTTADYNWNSNTRSQTEPYDSLAMWLLPIGIYKPTESLRAFYGGYQADAYHPARWYGLDRKCLLIRNQGADGYRGSTLILNQSGLENGPAWLVPDDFYDMTTWNAFNKVVDWSTNPSCRLYIGYDKVAEDATFVGAIAGSAGKRGLVPAPASGDDNKVLKGNGAWADWSQADYEQSDSTQNDYIKHRPFYDESVTTKTAYPAGIFHGMVNMWDGNMEQGVKNVIENDISAPYNYQLQEGIGITFDSASGQALISAMSSNTPINVEADGWYWGMEPEETKHYFVRVTNVTMLQDNSPETGGDLWYAGVDVEYSDDAWATTKNGYGVLVFASSTYIHLNWSAPYPDYGMELLFAYNSDNYPRMNGGYNIGANGVYTETTVQNTKQLDAKFVPVDNSTITVNAQGKLEASGGGSGVIELTSADFNYPVANPTGFATWLFPAGTYRITNDTQNSFNVYQTFNTSESVDAGNHFTFIVLDDEFRYAGNTYPKVVITPTHYGGNDLATANIYRLTSDGRQFGSGLLLTINSIYADGTNRTKIKIGSNASAAGFSSTALGDHSSASQNYSAALGYYATAAEVASIAIGPYSRTNYRGEVNIGSTQTFYGYNNSNYRLLSGVYDGQSAHDAATVGQLPATLTISQFNSILENA